MIPLITFVGPSGSGKTTLIEKIIKELSSRNLRVGTIKHHLKTLEVDHEGKDSWRHKVAGAKAVVIATPGGTAAIRSEDKEPDLTEIAERYLFDVDIVLAEGYKSANVPSIVVVREETRKELDLSVIRKPVAVMTDCDIDTGAVPRYSLDDTDTIAEFIAEKFLQQRPSRKVNLFVDGKSVPMKHFVRDIVEKTVRGLISSFKGIENPRKITIMIDEE